MENNAQLIAQCEATAKQWLSPAFDEETRKAVEQMLANEDKTDLIDAFYQNLEFGTGGLRGIMGVGTNRMNKYIVGMATQGFANYLLKAFPGKKDLAVVVGHDCRNNGRMFAETVADIFSANGIKAYLFESLRPTPEISFAIRELGCQAGVNVTASHNPREYNGYKAYWADGAQVLAPHDTGIIDEVNKVTIDDVKLEGNPDLIQIFPGLCQKGSRSIGAEHLLLPYHAMGVPIDEGIQTADIFNHFFTCPGRGGWIVTQVAYSDDFGSTGFADGIYRILNLVIKGLSIFTAGNLITEIAIIILEMGRRSIQDRFRCCNPDKSHNFFSKMVSVKRFQQSLSVNAI